MPKDLSNAYIGTSVSVNDKMLNKQLRWVVQYCTGGKSGHLKLRVETIPEKDKTTYILHFTSKDNVRRTASVELDFARDPYLFVAIKKYMNLWDADSFNVFLDWSTLAGERRVVLDKYSIIFYNVRGKEVSRTKQYDRLLATDVYALEAVQNKRNSNMVFEFEKLLHSIAVVAKILVGGREPFKAESFLKNLQRVVDDFVDEYQIPVTYTIRKEETCLQDELIQ